MRKQTFQHAEIRDENDNIINNGAYGKNTALSNKQNDGWVDYVMNNIEWLYEKGKTYASTDELINRTKDLANKSSLIRLASTEYVDGRIQHVVGTAPEALDTLGEIATALTTNKDKIGTIITEISTKADKGTVENALMGKAEKADVYTKSEVYTKAESDRKYQAKGDYATNKKVNECEKKQTLKKINATVNTECVDYFSCHQIGHTVQVNISVNDTTVSGGVIVRNLPKPLDELIFDSPIHGDDGKSIRLKLTLGGLLAFHFTNVYKTSPGKEFQTVFTYLTEDV